MVVAVFTMMGRFLITFAMNTGQQIIYEILPTQLRGQGGAMAQALGMVCNFFSPYIVYSVRSSTHSSSSTLAVIH